MKASWNEYGHRHAAAFDLWSRRPDIGLLTMSAAAHPPQQDFHQVRLECPSSERLIGTCARARVGKVWSSWDGE